MRIESARAREFADLIDTYDADISALQESKREAFAELRVVLESEGHNKASIRADVAALKAAVAKRAKRRIDADGVEEQDSLTDSYLDVIEAPAPRATRTYEGTQVLPETAAEPMPRRDATVTTESEHVDRSASAQPISVEPDVTERAPGNGHPEAENHIGQPSGAGAGSDVRAVAPIIADPFEAPEIPAFLDRRRQAATRAEA